MRASGQPPALPGERDEARQQQAALHPREQTVGEHQQQRRRDEDNDRRVELRHEPVNPQRFHQRRHAHHESADDEIRTDDIAQGQRATVGGGGFQADHHLRGAGAIAHDEQADDDDRHAQPQRQAGAAVHQPVRAPVEHQRRDEQCEPW